jgi:hypothetical protein
MSFQITQEIRASGVAKVIVILNQQALHIDADKTRSNVGKHFSSSKLSQTPALAASSSYRGAKLLAVRYYPNLGILFGTVDSAGLAGLRTEKDTVTSISGAPPLSLIRPTRTAAARLTQNVTWGITALDIPRV